VEVLLQFFLIISEILFDNYGVLSLDGIVVFEVSKRVICGRKVADWIVVLLNL
jgi:hypothetical protein